MLTSAHNSSGGLEARLGGKKRAWTLAFRQGTSLPAPPFMSGFQINVQIPSIQIRDIAVRAFIHNQRFRAALLHLTIRSARATLLTSVNNPCIEQD